MSVGWQNDDQRFVSTTRPPDDLRFYRRSPALPSNEPLNIDETAIIEQDVAFYRVILERIAS